MNYSEIQRERERERGWGGGDGGHSFTVLVSLVGET